MDYYFYLSLVLYYLLSYTIIQFLSSKLINNNNKTQQSTLKKLPPTPPTLPIFGNLLSLGTKPHISLHKLSKTYGPLMLLHLGQVPTIVISSARFAKEALQKNDLALASRHVIDGAHALDHHASSLAWLPTSSNLWRNLRKVCNSHIFSVQKLDSSRNIRKKKVEELLEFVKKESENGVEVDIGQVVFTTTLNLLSNTFFSVDLVDMSSENACEFREVIRSLMEELGKPNVVDFFPFLKKFDPQGVRRRLHVHFEKVMKVYNAMIEQRLEGKRPKGSMEGDGDVLDALLRISQDKTTEIKQSNIPHLLMDLFSAGTDTSSITVEWAMAELLRNPEKMKKAQAELNSVIGKNNPIEENNILRLPYLQAIVKETYRLHPPGPLLVPRKANTDVNIFDYVIPKDAQVLVNVWAIGRDPDSWENPNSFIPERFLGSEIDVKGHDFELIPFGSGRRICPGLPLASRMIHLMLGSLIHRFDWKFEEGIKPENMDMEEKFGLSLGKAQRLRAYPVQKF